MTRHPFRWDSLAFGVLFLAIVGNWAVWDQDLLTTRELSITASVALIVFGVLGILVSLRPAQPRTDSPAPTSDAQADSTPDSTDVTETLEPTDLTVSPEGTKDEETDPQS